MFPLLAPLPIASADVDLDVRDERSAAAELHAKPRERQRRNRRAVGTDEARRRRSRDRGRRNLRAPRLAAEVPAVAAVLYLDGERRTRTATLVDDGVHGEPIRARQDLVEALAGVRGRRRVD